MFYDQKQDISADDNVFKYLQKIKQDNQQWSK